MPIYEYACSQCGHEFEHLQKISDPLLTDCPKCYEASLSKKVTAAAFRLKGGGWYETDFKKDGRKNLVDGTSKNSDSGSGSSDSNKSASKESAGTAKKTDSDSKPKATSTSSSN